MIDTDLTLGAVIGFAEPSAKESSLSTGVARATEAVAKALSQIPALTRFSLTGDVMRELAVQLATPVRDLALNTWNKRAELRKYADKSKYPAEVSSKVPLLKHDLVETVKPTVKFTLGGVPLPPLEITAKVKFTFENVMLVIRDAKVTDVALGRIKAAVELDVGKVEAVKYESPEIAIRGSYHLKEPFPISRDESPA